MMRHNGMLTTIITLVATAAITAGVCVSCYVKGYEVGYTAGKDKTEFLHRYEVEQEKMSIRLTDNMFKRMQDIAKMSYEADKRAKEKTDKTK